MFCIPFFQLLMSVVVSRYSQNIRNVDITDHKFSDSNQPLIDQGAIQDDPKRNGSPVPDDYLWKKLLNYVNFRKEPESSEPLEKEAPYETTTDYHQDEVPTRNPWDRIITKIKNGRQFLQENLNWYNTAIKTSLSHLLYRVVNVATSISVHSAVLASGSVAIVMKWAINYRQKVRYLSIQREKEEMLWRQAEIAQKQRDDASETVNALEEELNEKAKEAEKDIEIIGLLKNQITELTAQLKDLDIDLNIATDDVKTIEAENKIIREKLEKVDDNLSIGQLQVLSFNNRQAIEKQREEIFLMSKVVSGVLEDTSKFERYTQEVRELRKDMKKARNEKIHDDSVRNQKNINELAPTRKQAGYSFLTRFCIIATFELLKAAFC